MSKTDTSTIEYPHVERLYVTDDVVLVIPGPYSSNLTNRSAGTIVGFAAEDPNYLVKLDTGHFAGMTISVHPSQMCGLGEACAAVLKARLAEVGAQATESALRSWGV